MQRLFVEPSQILEESHRICVNGGDVNHIRNVLRMKVGEELWVSDGQLEYHCEIESLTGEEILLHILYAQQPDYELKSRITCFRGFREAIRWTGSSRRRWSWGPGLWFRWK